MSDNPQQAPVDGIEAFKAATRPNPARQSDRQKIREHLPEIQRKMQEGWRHKEILENLAQTLDIRCQLSTFYNYVETFSKQEKKARRRASKKAPTEVSALPPPTAISVQSTEVVSDQNARDTQPPYRRVSETLGNPEYLANLRESKAKKTKPKLSMVERLNKPI